MEDGFWGGRRPSQKATEIASRQARRARQETDAPTVIREITVFPSLAQTYTKQDNATTFKRERRGGEASSPDITHRRSRYLALGRLS